MNKDILRVLRAAGAKFEQYDEYATTTPLYKLLNLHRLDAARLLIQWGADVNASVFYKITMRSTPCCCNFTALTSFSLFGDSWQRNDEVMRILMRAGADCEKALSCSFHGRIRETYATELLELGRKVEFLKSVRASVSAGRARHVGKDCAVAWLIRLSPYWCFRLTCLTIL